MPRRAVAVLLAGLSGDFVATKLALDDVAYEVLLDCGIRIQPLPIWEGEWAHPERYSNPRLLENIAREGFALWRRPNCCSLAVMWTVHVTAPTTPCLMQPERRS
jgi:hypothetical protein